MRILRGPSGDEISELVDTLGEAYKFNPASPVATMRGNPLARGIEGVRYNSLVLKTAINILGVPETKNALEVFNSKMPTILGKVLGRMPGTIGFDPQDDVDCANNNLVKFVGYLSLNKTSAMNGIEGFIGALELDSTYL